MIDASEESILKAILQTLALKHISCARVKTTGNIINRNGQTFFGRTSNQKGVPDLIFAYKGRAVACEVKSRKGRTSPEQEVWLKKWEQEPSAGYSFVARSVDDVLRHLAILDTF